MQTMNSSASLAAAYRDMPEVLSTAPKRGHIGGALRMRQHDRIRVLNPWRA